MSESHEWLNQQIFSVLARFLPHLDNNERLHSIFPHFRDCIEQILVDSTVCEEFYLLKCRLLFGRVVHSLLSIFEQKRNDKSIRLEAGRLLIKLFGVENEKCADSASIAFILPGVVTKCTFLIRSEPTSQFVETALKVVQNIIVTSFNNRLVRRLQKVADCESDSQLALRRDQKFFEASSEKIVESLQILIQHVAGTQSERDRLILLELFENLAQNCSSFFDRTKFIQLRLQLAVRFSVDEWENIQSMAVNAINEISQQEPDKFFEFSKTNIDLNLRNVLEKKSNSLEALQMLSQFMNILNEKQLKQLFKRERKTKNMFRRLRSALVLTVDVDLKRIVTCELDSEKKDMFISMPLKDTIKVEHLDRILTALVKNGLGTHFFRCIGNLLRSSSNRLRLPSALIMAHLCKVFSREGNKISQQFKIVIQNHLQFVWLKHLGTFLEKEPDPSNSDPIETSSLWHTRESVFCCALLASVSHSMQLMNPRRRDFQSLIVDVLYTILQFLPSTNSACASSSHVALEILANICNQTVNEFLNDNADKVVFKAAMQAQELKKYPRSPFALSALLDRGYGQGMVDQLANLVPELLCGISTEDSARIVPCLKAMRSFVLALTRWFPELTHPQEKPMLQETDENLLPASESDSDDETSTSDNQQNWQRLEQLREKFERLRQKETNKLEEQQSMQPILNDEKPEPPPLIKCVYKVLERIQHLHHSPFPYTRILLAELLCDSLRFIRQFRDQLLPMIHQNWVPMSISMRQTLRQTNRRTNSQSLSAPDKLIVAAELRSVACMCEVSTTFVCSKIANELDEPLQEYMKNAATTSQRTASVYLHSAGFKLQAAIIECWPIYCELAAVSEERALKTMNLYANDKLQNAKLRELASKAVEKLNAIENE